MISTAGGVLFTETRACFSLIALPLSVTRSFTSNRRGFESGAVKTRAGGTGWVLLGPPSPNVHRYWRGWPSGSEEALPLNCTVRGAGPNDTSGVATAVGGRLPPGA